MPKLDGTATTALVEGGRLRRADILLTHHKGSLWSWLIRRATHCYWNHAIIIYMDKDLAQGFDKTLIIDPKMGGIFMDNIARYLERPKRYDVAVRRLEAQWFQNENEEGERPYRQMVCDIALRETDDKYDSLLIRLCRRTLRQVRLAYRFVVHSGRYPKPGKILMPSLAQRLKVNTYSCSGFIQWCYYQGVSRILKDHPDKTRLQDVIFNPKLAGEFSDYDLLSTTPADIARSDRLAWKYVVKDGTVWEVSSEDEVNSIVKPGKAGRNG